MSDPIFVSCPADAWTLVASNVVTGKIWRAKTGVKYLHTYRDTGGAAPTNSNEGMGIFLDGEPDFEDISAANPIDVYIYAVGVAGRVRVDL